MVLDVLEFTNNENKNNIYDTINKLESDITEIKNQLLIIRNLLVEKN
jgi:hypothetical protein